MEKMVMIV